MTKFTISPSDADFSGFISLRTLCNFILQVAGDAADSDGCGLLKLRERNFSWVLCYLALDVNRMPRCGETIKAETWVGKVNRIFTYRYFNIYDEKGDIIISALSNWSIIDFTKRSMVNIVKEVECNWVQPKESNISSVRRVPAFEPQHIVEHVVKFSDIDMNQHTNSAKYLEWMCDSVQNPFETLHNIKRVDIGYIREAIYNEKVVIENAIMDDDQLFAIKNSDGEIVCNAIFSFYVD